MSDFESLTLALEDWFNVPFDEIPKELQARVSECFIFGDWDQLTAEQRCSLTLQEDLQHDPAYEHVNQFWFDFYARMHDIQMKISEWEKTTATTISDRTLKEENLTKLKNELFLMEKRQDLDRDKYYPERKQKEQSSTIAYRYIPYTQAIQQLRKRLNATPFDVAAWLFMGQRDGRLNAYLNANELDSPPRFFYYLGNVDEVKNSDYIAPLMYCWFRESDIANFEPIEHFITGEELLERWGNLPDM